MWVCKNGHTLRVVGTQFSGEVSFVDKTGTKREVLVFLLFFSSAVLSNRISRSRYLSQAHYWNEGGQSLWGLKCVDFMKEDFDQEKLYYERVDKDYMCSFTCARSPFAASGVKYTLDLAEITKV